MNQKISPAADDQSDELRHFVDNFGLQGVTFYFDGLSLEEAQARHERIIRRKREYEATGNQWPKE